MEKIVARVFRFDPAKDAEPRYETYEVPRTEGMVVADVLNYIYENFDGSLAYRWECRVRQCGSCGVVVNGRCVLACKEPVVGKMTIEPLSTTIHFIPLIRDLVVDRDSVLSRIEEIRGYTRTRQPLKLPEPIDQEKVSELRMPEECIRCFICIAPCPIRAPLEDSIPPPFFNRVFRFSGDPRDEEKQKRLGAIRESIWLCTNCGACEVICPNEITVSNVATGLRNMLVDEGFIPKTIKDALTSTLNRGNPWQGLKRNRLQWAETLTVKDLSKGDKAELLYFVGCTSCYDTRAQDVARSMVGVFNDVGVDFATLGNEEKCCGDPILRLGERGLFDMLVEENEETFKKYDVKKIVTTCPHSYDAFLKQYPSGGGKLEVQHHTQLISKLIEEGRLNFSKRLSKVVTYHDPCFLGRHNDIYEAPRKVLEAIPGLKIVEMERNRENSYCCGGGAGRIWMDEAGERPPLVRAREAAEVQPDILVTACPFCLINMEDAIKVIGMDDKIVVKDVVELVREAM